MSGDRGTGHAAEEPVVTHHLRNSRVALLLALFYVFALVASASALGADFGPGFKTQSAAVDGGTANVTGGSGPPVVLIHGYAESSRM